jgi:hypothetical protein
MKQPRIADFLPDQQKPLKSSMDDFPTIQKPPQAPIPPEQKQAQSQVTSTPVPPYGTVFGRRKIKQRHPFDIYQDQYDELKRISFENITSGGMGNMSAMVREAIDLYLQQLKKK